MFGFWLGILIGCFIGAGTVFAVDWWVKRR